jgi:hypothetical protein
VYSRTTDVPWKADGGFVVASTEKCFTDLDLSSLHYISHASFVYIDPASTHLLSINTHSRGLVELVTERNHGDG